MGRIAVRNQDPKPSAVASAEIEEHRLELERVLDDITSVAEPDVVITGPDAPPILEYIEVES